MKSTHYEFQYTRTIYLYLGFFLRLAQRHSVMLSSLTTVCMLPVSVSMFALALCEKGETQKIRNGHTKLYWTLQNTKSNPDSCTLRASSVVRMCLAWTSSCKFIIASWYLRLSCGFVASLSRTSSSSISYKRKQSLNKVNRSYFNISKQITFLIDHNNWSQFTLHWFIH